MEKTKVNIIYINFDLYKNNRLGKMQNIIFLFFIFGILIKEDISKYYMLALIRLQLLLLKVLLFLYHQIIL